MKAILGAPSKLIGMGYCKNVGTGLPALKYLSRYLYCGVISENNTINDTGTEVTFRYKDSKTDAFKTRTVRGEDFLWLLLQHVLPKGFRRVRDYGYLHSNAKKTLKLIQWILRVALPEAISRRPDFKCPQCKNAVLITGFIRPAWKSG